MIVISEAAEVEQESTPTERPEESTPASQFRDGSNNFFTNMHSSVFASVQIFPRIYQVCRRRGKLSPRSWKALVTQQPRQPRRGPSRRRRKSRCQRDRETDSQKEKRRAYDAEWVNCHTVITSSSSIEPITIDIFSKSEEGEVSTPDAEEVFKTIVELFESELFF